MSETELRKVMIRVVLDGEFSNLLHANPKKALKGYTLTDDEKAMLTNPTMDLVNKFISTEDLTPFWIWFFFPPTVDDTTTMLTDANKKKVTQLIRDIRNSADRERFDMIMNLVRQVQLEDQTHDESPKHE